MNNENATNGGGRDIAEESAQAEVRDSTLDDSLRSLRLRRYESQSYLPSQPESLDPEPANLAAEELEETMDDPAAQSVEQSVDESEEVNQEKSPDVLAALDEVNQEVRRLGREMFRANRVSERNQEIFDEAIGEIRNLASTVALIPAQHNEAISSAKFEAKAELCRELLRLSDTLRMSLSAAGELVDRLQAAGGAQAANRGMAFWFSTTRQLSDSLTESIGAMKQWRDGQQLLFERLQSILRTAGVREIETAGRPFDPAIHRAVSVAESNDLSSGTIASEELKGYTLDGRILRYAEVIVVK